VLGQIDGDWLLQQAPVVVVLIVALYGAWKEWWVPGPTHRRVIVQRDEFMRLLLRSTITAEKATEVMRHQQESAEQIATRAAADAVAAARAEGRIS
jgi:hypothetical protein